MTHALKAMREQIKEERKNMRKTQPWHETVPDLLLDKVAELNGILAKHRAKHGNAKGMEFYESLLKVMQLSYDFMKGTDFIHEENTTLRWLNQFLTTHNQVLQERVNEFETVIKLQAEDRLEEMFENARIYTEQSLKHRDLILKIKARHQEKEQTAEIKTNTTND